MNTSNINIGVNNLLSRELADTLLSDVNGGGDEENVRDHLIECPVCHKQEFSTYNNYCYSCKYRP